MAEVKYMPCKGEHIQYIKAQQFQKREQIVLLSPEYLDVISNGFGLSGWIGNKCIGASGLVHLFPHRAIAWALLAEDAGPYMLQITRKIRQVLATDLTPRIECTVATTFPQAARWAHACGMRPETGVLRHYGAQGEDEIMYVRIRQ